MKWGEMMSRFHPAIRRWKESRADDEGAVQEEEAAAKEISQLGRNCTSVGVAILLLVVVVFFWTVGGGSHETLDLFMLHFGIMLLFMFPWWPQHWPRHGSSWHCWPHGPGWCYSAAMTRIRLY